MPEIYNKLIVNRPKDINLQTAIDIKEHEVEFLCNTGWTEMISGIKDYYDPRHKVRLERENAHYGSKTELLKVKTKTLESIFEEHKIDHVNYLSVDVEGAEYAVIKSINFDKVFIDVIGFENNYGDSAVPIIAYLEAKGYTLLDYKCLDIFMIHNKSKFK